MGLKGFKLKIWNNILIKNKLCILNKKLRRNSVIKVKQLNLIIFLNYCFLCYISYYFIQVFITFCFI